MSDFYTVSEFAKLTGKDPSRIRRLLAYGKIRGEKLGKQWIIPKDVVYPKDERVKSGRYRNWRKKTAVFVCETGDVIPKEDPFKEYLQQTEPDKREKGYAWQTAIGLQKVDGLTTSEYLIKTAIKNIEGEISIDQAGELLEEYYQENPKKSSDERTEEADKVSQRIAKLLSEEAFSFTPNEYLSIHRKLFRGIYDHAGIIRNYNISKKEWILNGETVVYGSASELRATLEYDFSQEKMFTYKGLDMDEIIRHLAFFISRLWQIHVFSEGNTRTTAVFFIKYLRSLGFAANNAIFADNAWYFRNAMVRANYNDLKHGIVETTEYLELFLRNLLLNEKNQLHNRSMHISGLFNVDEKQDFYLKKQDIDVEKQDIVQIKQDIGMWKQDNVMDNLSSLSNKSRKNIETLLNELGYHTVFGRNEVMDIVGISASPASALLRKMKEAGVIETVAGNGKGRYRFIY